VFCVDQGAAPSRLIAHLILDPSRIAIRLELSQKKSAQICLGDFRFRQRSERDNDVEIVIFIIGRRFDWCTERERTLDIDIGIIITNLRLISMQKLAKVSVASFGFFEAALRYC
ncbi:hypothetical protein AL036_06485, partial [Salipiger aestuarii]